MDETKSEEKTYETYTLVGDCGKITIYRDNGTCHLICDLKPKDPRPNIYQFNFDGKYVDKDTNLSYKLFVKVGSTGKHQVNYAKKFASGTYGTLRTDDKVVAEELSYNMVKFQGDRCGVKIDVIIPQVALTHKFIYDQKSKGPRRLGNMGLHDKHGVQEITSVVNGGRFSPK